MGISSLGVGSGILTQSVLDQLRKADDAKQIRPITLNLANENDKKNSLQVIDASMTNFRDSINALKSATVFNGRSATVTGTSVEVTASSNSDIQDFTINVNHLATKQIEQSGAFTASTDLVASGMVGTGTMTLNVGTGTPVSISYDGTTTLKGLKNLINKNAGNQVDATLLQVSPTESRLVISAVGTGASNNISITDNSAGLDTKLTTGLTTLQAGLDNQFTFNGQTITRADNTITDLVSGYTINLKEAGSSNVSVAQDRTSIETKVDSFVAKYNSIVTELGKQTLSSTNSTTRGIFSGESSVKNMKSSIENMIAIASGGGGNMQDYGFTVARDGTMSIDKTVFNAKLDANATNVKAFFTGGNFTKANNSVVTLTGVFNDFYNIANSYTKVNGGLDQLSNSISATITSLQDRQTSATNRLDAKYAIMKKKYTAYNTLINKFNSASSIFTQLSSSTTTSSRGY